MDKYNYRGRARMLTEMTFLQHLPGGVDDVGVLGLVDDGVLDLQMRYNHRIVEGYAALPRSMAKRSRHPPQHRCRSGPLGFRSRTRTASGRQRIGKPAPRCRPLPVGVLKSGAVQFEPALPESKQWALTKIEMGPIIKVLLQFKEVFWPSWMEMVACATGPINLYWTIFRGVPGKPPVLSSLLPGAACRGVVGKRSEEETIEIVMADLRPPVPEGRAQAGARRLSGDQLG